MVLLYMGQNVLEKRWMANSSIMINFFKLDLKEWKVIKWKVNCFLLKAFDLGRWRNSYSAMARVSEYRMHLLKNFAIIMFSLHRSCLPKEIDPVPPTSLSINGAYITLYGYASKGPKLDRHMSRSMLHCSHLCLKNTRCISFNYQVSFPRSGLCELSEEGNVIICYLASSSSSSSSSSLFDFIIVRSCGSIRVGGIVSPTCL